jgi:hypothetical protein
MRHHDSPSASVGGLFYERPRMSEAARLREDAIKCRRQAEVATDLMTMNRLTILANEYDAKAKRMEDAVVFPKR